MNQTVKQIRSVLEALAKADSADNDTKEIVYDRELARIRELDRDGIILAVKEAVGSNVRRKRFASFVFSELYEVPGIEAVFQELLETADNGGRADIIQTIGLRKMGNLVGVLNNHFSKESDDFCRGCLLSALGKIADESSLPIFIYLMNTTDQRDEWLILAAAHNFARPEFQGYLATVFERESTKTSHKIMSAWGLAKLGERSKYDYLVFMLDDPEIRTPNSYDPGHSKRAAQAIADINSWEFEWSKNSVDIVKARVKHSNSPKIS